MKIVLSIVMFLWSLSMLIGCSSPHVQPSLISPETKSIDTWYINLVNDRTAADSLPSIAALRQEFGVDEKAKDYIEAVKIHLVDNGINVSDDPTDAVGTINVKVQGPGMYGEIHDVQKGMQAGYTKRAPDDTDTLTSYVELKETNNVSEVNINLKSPDGRFLGQVDIDGHRIKPEFTADVIKKLIRTGEY